MKDRSRMPFKFGQSKKTAKVRFPSVLLQPSGTMLWPQAKKSKLNGLNVLAREDKELKR
jgi:hypothetical protein